MPKANRIAAKQRILKTTNRDFDENKVVCSVIIYSRLGVNGTYRKFPIIAHPEYGGRGFPRNIAQPSGGLPDPAPSVGHH